MIVCAIEFLISISLPNLPRSRICVILLNSQAVRFRNKGYSRKGNIHAGSVKLKKGLRRQHEANDYFHMNAEFGAVALAELLCATG